MMEREQQQQHTSNNDVDVKQNVHRNIVWAQLEEKLNEKKNIYPKTQNTTYKLN